MSTYEAIILERDGHVATIRLNRPEKHNAISSQMSQDLIDCLDAIEPDNDVRVIVLTGVGERAFCAGADMTEAVEMMASGSNKRDHAAVANVRVLRVKKPIIAAVNGYAYGGGALMAINCDIRLCADNARFRFVGASYGLVGGGSQLPRIVGAPLAKELIFTARTVDADEALRIGLANHVVSIDELESAALQMANEIATHSPSAILASKEVIDIATSVKDAARSELAHNLELRQSDEHRERFRAATDRVTKRG
ncbi:MAG: enoyl-CoA hydratase/isomerase family protein [Chloroflexi bacterium]|nr:enoyl-CoA hydratase/isomerase family protein [Chloroflexota bacterium]